MNESLDSSTAFLAQKLVKTDKICPIHNINMVTIGSGRPVCLECAKESLEEQNAKQSIDGTQLVNKRRTQSWLFNRSIYLDKTLAKASFDNYRTDDQETTKNKAQALKIAREYFKGETFNTLLSGNPGTGKSHLSMSMLREINEYSNPYRKCLFVSIDELMRRIRSSFNNPNSQYDEQSMVAMLIEADVLVIDDLGAETGAITTGKGASDFTTRILYAIINGRMTKPTIFTTNLNSDGLSDMYDGKLVSRMFRGAKGHVISFKNTTDKRIVQF